MQRSLTETRRKQQQQNRCVVPVTPTKMLGLSIAFLLLLAIAHGSTVRAFSLRPTGTRTVSTAGNGRKTFFAARSQLYRSSTGTLQGIVDSTATSTSSNINRAVRPPSSLYVANPVQTNDDFPKPASVTKTTGIDIDADTDPSLQSSTLTPKRRNVMKEVYRMPRRAVRLYRDYAKRLWNETNPSARRRIANDKVKSSIRSLQHTLRNDEYHEYVQDSICTKARDDVLLACKHMLSLLPDQQFNQSLLKSVVNSTIRVDEEIVLLQRYAEQPSERRQQQRQTTETAVVAQLNMTSTTTAVTADQLEVSSAQSTVVLDEAGNAINMRPSTVQTHPSALEPSSRDVASSIVKNNKPGGSTHTPAESAQSIALTTAAKTNSNDNNAAIAKKAKKKSRSVMFGALMGAIVALWVFSGNYIFAGLFTLMTILGQLEYYRMVMNTGIYPARRISVIGASSMFLTALFAPSLHEICLPMFGLWAMIWFLTMRRQVTSIAEIATTFTGMFYLGYVPSFWVRTRLIGSTVAQQTTRLASVAEPMLSTLTETVAPRLPDFLSSGRWVPFPITTGSKFIFWTWLCLAFSDVGAYFVGRKYGKTKLGVISPAAGATSPNKSVEGVIGGCAVSAVLGILGAWVQKWPYFAVTGAVHGVMLGLLGLIGDLTASMLKRDAGLKDFGDLIPEHGGILDRVDSFIWSAPYSWLVCAYVIPALRAVAGTR